MGPNTKADKAGRTERSLRRTPQQERSQATVETILQATIQILEKEGEAALTTNHVANVAGFSVGTVYQYFPNKESLIRDVGARVQAMLLQQTERKLQELSNDPHLHKLDPYQLVYNVVDLVIQTLTLNGKNKPLVRLYWLLEQPEQTETTIKAMSDLLSGYMLIQQHPMLKTPNAVEMFALTRAVSGVVRSASLEGYSLMSSEALVACLTRMAYPLLVQCQTP